MGVNTGPDIVTDGLQLCIDKNDDRSYLGEPFTNLANTRPGGAMTAWSHANGTYSSREIVTMNTPVGNEADKLILKQSGTNGWFGSPNACTIYSGGTWAIANGVSYYYGCWIYTGNWSEFNSYVYRYVTGSFGWPSFSDSGLTKIVDGRVWKWYKGFYTSTGSGVEYFVFFKNGTFSSDMVFYVAGATTHVNGNRNIAWVDGTRSLTDGWQDLSGNDNHGDLTSLTYSSTKVPFTLSNNFSFASASNNKITVANDSVLTTAQTWGVWVKFNALPATNSYDSIYIKSADWNQTGGIGLQIIYNNLTWSWGNNWGGTCSVAQSTLSTGVWYYIVGTSPGDTSTNGCKFYINGDLKDTGTAAVIPSNSYNLEIGYGHGGGMDGEISRFEVWTGELTAAEVLQNYDAHKSRYGL